MSRICLGPLSASSLVNCKVSELDSEPRRISLTLCFILCFCSHLLTIITYHQWLFMANHISQPWWLIIITIMVTTTNIDWRFTYEPGTSASIAHVLTHLIFMTFLWGLLLALFHLQALRDRSSATLHSRYWWQGQNSRPGSMAPQNLLCWPVMILTRKWGSIYILVQDRPRYYTNVEFSVSGKECILTYNLMSILNFKSVKGIFINMRSGYWF